MISIIVAFPKMEDAKTIGNILFRHGYDSPLICTSGAQAVSLASGLDKGIILCGYRLQDMHYSELYEYLPEGFELLLAATPARLAECADQQIVCLSMPVKVRDLLNTVEMMTYKMQQRKRKDNKRTRIRNEHEKELIYKAKAVLMERNNMTEQEAHRYIQKFSMDSGTNMAEMSEMILTMFIN